MRLISFKKYISLLLLIFLFTSLYAEEQIDIWNKEKKDNSLTNKDKKDNNIELNPKIIVTSQTNNDIKIENEILEDSQNLKIFGIFDPAENDFDLNMWSATDAEDVRSSIKRIKKI